MKEFWEDRYRNETFAYGIKPNEFFESILKNNNLKGAILLPAEGEGRNAVFAAKNGLNVTCLDISSEGKTKALKLASENNVTINYLIGEMSEFVFKENSFDVIALIYAHFSPSLKSEYHKKISRYLKKGGILILEGFSKEQLKINEEKNTELGPKNLEMLFSLEEIKSDFSNLETIEIKQEEIELNEGIYHKGKASVIRYIGKKHI
ncbi:methyltransferase family protein [Lutibacter oceani]|uniref:Methyltransferase family protein n=1 Tax=Lutibacter oceani TaxID=1853311 RepID=A0A3D9RV53_9FLAO|nr:class I SAM-dependent methyltransferase [Lutibacter oceani]REE83368.1 methyltransferase family protein [Lutibacter oceani]